MTEYSYNKAIPTMNACPCCNTSSRDGCSINSHVNPCTDTMSVVAVCGVCGYKLSATIDRSKATNIYILIKDLWNVKLHKDGGIYE